MAPKKDKSQVDIAREALLKLTQDKIPLTPDSFRAAYDAIAGISSRDVEYQQLSKAISGVLTEYAKGETQRSEAYRRFSAALKEKKWETIENELSQLLLNDHAAPVTDVTILWRDLLIHVLEIGLLSQFKGFPELERKTRTLLEQAKVAHTSYDVMKLTSAFKGYLRKLEKNQQVQATLHQSMVKLFRLLVENMVQLSQGDHWMDGQVEMLREVINKPMCQQTLDDAENKLRALLARQAALKESLLEAKLLLKELAASCIEILSEVSENTGEYTEKIEAYQHEIETVDDILSLKSLIERIKQDTHVIHLGTKQAYDGLRETHNRVLAANELIDKLSLELDQASQLAYRDFLTGALNRRGMEDALEREFARADRTGKPLCLAMLDIDHFKSINDSLGHEAGDEAIMHLAMITQLALRPTDVLARFGGEEFLIILPETDQETGVQVLTRVQRELTKSLFLHKNEKRLITFSAGVSARSQGEGSDPVLKRVDTALYQAKGNGRNQVVAASNPHSLSSSPYSA